MNYYPIFLDLRSKPCLVVGGGEIATRKVNGLLSAGADVTVISPKVTDAIHQQAQQKRLRHLKRRYQEGDVKRYFLAYAATGLAEVDVIMVSEASAANVLLNVVDRSVLCSFISPAIVQRGELSIAISTGGQCPGFSRRVRQEIEQFVNPAYGTTLAELAAGRKVLMQDRLLKAKERRHYFEELLELAWKELHRETGQANNAG